MVLLCPLCQKNPPSRISKPSGRPIGRTTTHTPLTALPFATMFSQSTHLLPRSVVPCIWGIFFLTRTRMPLHGSGGCEARQFFIQWDGTTMGCPQNDAFKTSLVLRVIPQCNISHTCNHRFGATHPKTINPFLYHDRISSSSAKNSPPKMKRSLKTSFAASACQLIGHCSTPQSKTDPDELASGLFCATSLAARHTRKKLLRCGT